MIYKLLLLHSYTYNRVVKNKIQTSDWNMVLKKCLLNYNTAIEVAQSMKQHLF
jgi:hypothetical protein